MARLLDDAKKRVKKTRKKGPKVTAGRRPGGKVWLLLVPVAVVGGYFASRFFRNSEDTEVSDISPDQPGTAKTTD
jgi:hypothetical protein